MDCIYKIRVNRPCKLYIDGEELMCLDEQKLTKIQLQEGEYLRKVISTDNDAIICESKVILSGKSLLDDIILDTNELEKARINALPIQKVKIDGLYFQCSSTSPTLRVTNPSEKKEKYSFEHLSIPSHIIYKGYIMEVTEIDDSAFSNCSNIVSVKLPNTIRSIGSRAFYGCSSLRNIIIPDSVKYIGFKAFAKCSNLSFVSVGWGIDKLNNGVFDECDLLTTIAITENIKYIAPDTISNVTNIKLNVSDVKNICNGYFGQLFYDLRIGCEGNELYINDQEVTQLIIPDSITRIEECAFYGFSNLLSITIPESVVYIGCSAFSGCFSLNSIIIPSSIIYIGRCAFYEHGLSAIILKSKTLPECYGNLFTWRFPGPILYANEEVLSNTDDTLRWSGWNECCKKLPIRFKSNDVMYEVTSHKTVSALIENPIANSVRIPDEVVYNDTRFVVTSIEQL